MIHIYEQRVQCQIMVESAWKKDQNESQTHKNGHPWNEHVCSYKLANIVVKHI